MSWATRPSLRSGRLSFPFLACVLALLAAADAAKFSPIASQCSSCRFLVRTFQEGVQRTTGQKWTGGDAHWEAEKLGKYESSETRLVEIMETVCKKKDGKTDRDYGLDAMQDNSNHKCHQFLEQYEEDVENWYFHKQKNSPDLLKWLCIEHAKVCCPADHYGADCSPCPNVPGDVCFAHGTCDGEGTRGGKGTCSCFAGYVGLLCRKCAFNYVSTHQNDTHVTCEKCDESCQGACSETGPKGCGKCKDGYGWVDTKGCEDVNECEEADPCEEDAHSTCKNSPGAYECECMEGFKKQDNKCQVDIEAAMKKVEQATDEDIVKKIEEAQKNSSEGNSEDNSGEEKDEL